MLETTPDIDVDLEILLMEEHDDEVMCESQAEGICLNKPPHRADWYAFSPCGSVIAVCERRRKAMKNVGSWKCSTVRNLGGHREWYHEITWVPIDH